MVPVTYRASFSYLLRHPWQLALALLGISVGVAVIVAVDLANASARKAFLLSMDAITGEATHQVIGGPRGVDENVYAQLRVKHGRRAIAPVIEGSVTIDDTTLSVLGVDLFAEREIRTFTWEAQRSRQQNNSACQSAIHSISTWTERNGRQRSWQPCPTMGTAASTACWSLI
jgi:putative ABC transport system permease protein